MLYNIQVKICKIKINLKTCVKKCLNVMMQKNSNVKNLTTVGSFKTEVRINGRISILSSVFVKLSTREQP